MSKKLIILILFILVFSLLFSDVAKKEKQSFVDVLKEFQGIIGIVVGVLLALFIPYFSRKIGSILIYLNKFEIEFYKTNNIGGMEKIKISDECEYGNCTIDIDFYNSSTIYKVVRDLNLLFKSKSIIIKKEFSDVKTRQFIHSQTKYDTLKYINLPPQTNENFQLIVFIKKDDIKHFITDDFDVLLIGNRLNTFRKKLEYKIGKSNKGKIEVRQNYLTKKLNT